MAVFSACTNLLYLTPTLYMLQVYDRVIPSGNGLTLLGVSLIGGLGLFTLALLEWMRARLLVRVSLRLERLLSRTLLETVLGTQALSRQTRARTMRDFDIVRQALAGAPMLALVDAPWAPIYLLAAWALHPWLGLLCLGSTLLLMALAIGNERATVATLRAANDVATLGYARQEQASNHAHEIRALGMDRALAEHLLRDRIDLNTLQTHASLVAAAYAGVVKFARLVLQSAALGLGAWLAIRQQLAPGAVIAASLLLARALGPIEQLVAAWRPIASARDAWGRLATVLESAGAPDRTSLPPARGELRVEHVCILSTQSRRPILEDVSFHLEAGGFVGVVGPSGAGKSTLLRAIAGAAETMTGHIRLDGASLNDWNPQELARNIGFLPQEPILFSGTIADNIARFDRDLTGGRDQAVTRAARAAGAHDMILRLPCAYETRVGPGAEGLSLGQMQRIALARALYGKPRLLVLDEPNAHLDANSEYQLCETLTHLTGEGVTILIAAHHGSVLNGAHKLLHLNGGKVVDYSSLHDVAERLRRALSTEAASRRSDASGSAPLDPQAVRA